MSVPEIVKEVGSAEAENEAKVRKFLRGGGIQCYSDVEITPEVMIEAIDIYSLHIAEKTGLSRDEVYALWKYLEKKKASQ